MIKKLLTVSTLFVGSFLMVQPVYAQDKKEETIERPSPSGLSSIDAYMVKSFDTYDESKKISQDIEFIKVDIKEVPANKDGVTTELKITNGKGEQLTKTSALTQFGSLLVRATKQNVNIGEVTKLQTPASEELKTAPMMKKPKGTKEYAAATNAQAFVVSETKKQIDLLNQQISTLKALKNN